MIKRKLFAVLALLLLLLAGCAEKTDAPNQPKSTEYYLSNTDLPLDDAVQLRAVPDFLTEEQQLLYR